MVFDALVIVVVVGSVWWWQRRPRSARHVRTGYDDTYPLPFPEDLLPLGAFDAVPADEDLAAYASAGVERLENYLMGRDKAV
jgi:hypothetical protein